MLPAGEGPALDTVVVGVGEPVDPSRLRNPATSGERLVARQLARGLVRMDCRGVVRPDLAQHWQRDAAGAGWILTLSPDARLTDGRPIDAAQVRTSWLAADPGRTWFVTGRLRVEVLAPRRLWVQVAGDADSVPARLTDPALGVWGSGSDDQAPVGSGAYRLEAPAGRDQLVLTPVAAGPVIRVRSLPPELDRRDAFDQPSSAIDVLITRDPATEAYAGNRGDLIVTPLPWDRTYVLLMTGPAPAPDGAVREALARDAVRAEARAALPPFWWEGGEICPAEPASGTLRPGSPVRYPADDAIARALAERIVALAATTPAPGWLAALSATGGPPLRAAATAPSDFGEAIARQEPAIVDWPRLARVDCPTPGGLGAAPLVDSRAALIRRSGVPPLRVEGDGTVVVLPR